MKKRLLVTTLLCMGILAGSLAGCGNAGSDNADNAKISSEETAKTASDSGSGTEAEADLVNKEGFPIVNEEITLRVFGQQGSVQQPWDTMAMWKKYQEMTGIKLDFTNVLSAEGYDEKKSLMWASDDYDDVFVRAFLSNSEIVKYGSMGILIPLEDMLEEYAPNMSRHIKENPAILSRITAPDGHIYALPALIDLTAARDEKFWINTKWLDQVGCDVPKSIEDLEAVLRAFKGVDFNGNGTNDEVPMSASDAQTLIRRFAGVWGHQWQFDTWLEVENDTVSTYLTDDSFKEELMWLHDMYAEGLIDEEIFTQEYAKYISKASGQLLGLFFNQADDAFDSTDYIGIAPFTGVADKQYVQSAPIARDNGVFAISCDCKYPEAALRWIDYFYSDEGSILLRYGVEGENMYFDEDGLPRYNDGILDSPDGSGTEIGKFTIWPGGGAPQLVNEVNCEAIASANTLAAQVALDPCVPENIYSAPLFTDEVNDRVTVLWTDLESYMKTQTALFIRGEASFDEWDTYVQTLKDIGIDEWVSIYQEAYDKLK
ncbi:extracellular solute-binding protein [Butyrivibrio sp. MC2013]|uniref:extracellular solute-binding protein n=1 Tax=Butyrivibrio sp. MC2013 TaxID=1280686 RepID=UPI0009DB7D78|nr:extracellular solute-binding protein [Butyrivibrio sp. MC2013]